MLNPTDNPLPRLFGAANQDNHPHRQAVDGRSDTFWVSWGQATGEGPSPAAPIDFALDLGAPVTVGSVGVDAGCHAEHGSRDFEVQASDDGRHWVSITTVTDAAKGRSTASFEPFTTRYLRRHITASWDEFDRNVQIADLVVSAP